MTREEEIKQAAEQFCDLKAYPYQDGFIAGAEWADQHQVSEEVFCKNDLNYIQGLEDGKKLSPWISVEDRLPKEGLMIARYNNGLAFSYYMYGKWVVQCAAIGRPLINETPTHWMPIPELKK